MSELTKIILGLAILLSIVYSLLIWSSLSGGKDITIYQVSIAINILIALWFWYVATRRTGDPQDGMGLGPIMLICGTITILIPLICVIVYFIRRF
ncbi:small-conductance mechanosensitive channel [Pedobacter africanus]|uniref:Small-conductance mechanosensitive channel n=1 Tax=Pedobacter africanus TaxID=151894 RepID=A0ACC6L1M7_9SPHI|nr:hypothetical protein [Pedobacter africanus]MDR6785545.1 small-conductance mechanosensitive channel [Pedobacter africanus]